MTDVHPTDVSGDGRPATLAIPGVRKTRCPECGREDHWHDDAFPIPKVCAACGGDLVITATTGHTIEEAITHAAQELSENVEPRQPSIPGLTPVFDLAAALDAIEDAALDARLAERDYEQVHEAAKVRRKAADTANAKLRDLIATLTERRHDARYEGNTNDKHGIAEAIGHHTTIAATETPDAPDDSGVDGTREQTGTLPSQITPTPGVPRNPGDLSPGVGETR